MADQPKITLNPFIFPSLTRPNGYLSKDMRAQACWYFYTLAQSAKELVGDSTEDQIILEGQEWMDTRYENQARAVATLYGLDSPDEFAKAWNQVTKQAKALGLPKPDPKYMRPLKRFITRN